MDLLMLISKKYDFYSSVEINLSPFCSVNWGLMFKYSTGCRFKKLKPRSGFKCSVEARTWLIKDPKSEIKR